MDSIKWHQNLIASAAQNTSPNIVLKLKLKMAVLLTTCSFVVKLVV